MGDNHVMDMEIDFPSCLSRSDLEGIALCELAQHVDWVDLALGRGFMQLKTCD